MELYVTNGSTVSLNIKVRNTQNIDDVFRVQINASEINPAYRLELSWFDWTEKTVSVRTGQEVIIPVNVTIPAGVTGTRSFRAKANSVMLKTYAYDTGYLKIS